MMLQVYGFHLARLSMNDDRFETIPLKQIDGPPWRWWVAGGLALLTTVTVVGAGRWYSLPPEPGEIELAIAVDPDDPDSMRLSGARPDTLISVEASAANKSELYPDAITNRFETSPVESAAHPLDPALEVAQLGLERRAGISDYTARIIKRERIGNDIKGPEVIEAKIRRRRTLDDGTSIPFAVYLKFVQPRGVAGREVIWAEGQNDGNLVAHETGLLNLVTLRLDPDGSLAMNGNRYPITEIGFDTLITRMMEKGNRDRRLGPCRVEVDRWSVLGGRPCTSITIVHDDHHPEFDFHRATIVIDDELNLPVKYAAYDWPAEAGGEPLLLEEYTYLDIRLDVGLTDLDFDPANPAYAYP